MQTIMHTIFALSQSVLRCRVYHFPVNIYYCKAVKNQQRAEISHHKKKVYLQETSTMEFLAAAVRDFSLLFL